MHIFVRYEPPRPRGTEDRVECVNEEVSVPTEVLAAVSFVGYEDSRKTAEQLGT